MNEIRHGFSLRPDAPHVLLVDDDAGMLAATRMLLVAEGYRVTAASLARAALQHITDDANIDLIVSDYHLGEERTGLDVIAAARRQLGSDLKAVLITGDVPPAMRETTRSGGLRIASKPLDADVLLAMLGELVCS